MLDNPGPRGHEKVIPVQVKPIDDIDSFAAIIVKWHATAGDHCDRLMDIPEGSKLEYIDHATGETHTLELTGDILQAFQLGVLTAAQQFVDLPFTATAEDPEDVPG